MAYVKAIIVLVVSLLSCNAFTSKPSFQRSGQQAKPQSSFPIFSDLSPSSVTNGKGKYEVFEKLSLEDTTQTKLTPEQVSAYNAAIESLPSPIDSLNVNGGWKLLATISPEAEAGDNVDFFDINSWKNYIAGTGPSPFQSLVTGSSRVNGLTQFLTSENFDNLVEFKVGPIDGKLVLKASLESIENNKRTFRFQRGFFLFKTIWNSSITLPYPVPFKLLGDRAVGWLDTIGYDEASGFRAAIGNKGTKFIFQRMNAGEDVSNDQILPEDVVIASQLYSSKLFEWETDEEEKKNNEGLPKRAVIICPQQFGGKPGDYTELERELRKRGHPVYLARISELDWLSITKSVFTEAYFKGELEPRQALPFYVNAINKAVDRMTANHGESEEFTILSHSIGGWIARAWLGEVASEKVRNRCKRYVSLGTPHIAPPEDSLVSKVDQTRGLLKYINDRWPGAYWDDIVYTCVASKEVKGKTSLDIESLLALASYFALVGEGNVDGDGITPVKGALLEGAESIVLDGVYHADVLPNPVGRRNTKLIGCKWYVDKIDEWAGAL